MPQKKSAEKSLRQIKRRTVRNDKVRKNLDYLFRQLKKSLETNNTAKVNEYIQQLTKALDKAVEKRVLHKNAAARKKSRLMKKVNTHKKK